MRPAEPPYSLRGTLFTLAQWLRKRGCIQANRLDVPSSLYGEIKVLLS